MSGYCGLVSNDKGRTDIRETKEKDREVNR
jgi:hypothetical protein